MTSPLVRRARLQLELLESRLAPATFKVTTLLDVVNASDGLRSLREAITKANTTTEADTIELQAGEYKISGAAGEDANASGDFDITSPLTIKGTGATATFIDGARLDRVFEVFGPIDVKFVKVTIRNGLVNGDGGGISTLSADVKLNKTTVSGNESDATGGGISTGTGATLTVKTSIVTGNQSGFAAGGIFCTEALSISNSEVSDNHSGFGGGIFVSGSPVTIIDSRIVGNSAIEDGGGIWTDARPITLTDSILSGNQAGANGGGIYTLDANLTFTRSDVSDNTAGDDGGGISTNDGNLTLIESTVNRNKAGSSGGGIDGGGIITIDGTTFSENEASQGAGINTFGNLLMNTSTFHGNRADGSGGGLNLNQNSASLLMNVTFSGNTADFGGGFSLNRTTTNLLNVTITRNVADTGAGIGRGTGATINVKNSIIAQNFAATDPDVTFITSQGHNLIGVYAFAASPTDHTGTATNPLDPKLGDLADNGGLTFTHALLTGSRAIDNGDTVAAPGTDQRGVARPKDGDRNGTRIADIGAFERQ